MRGLCPIVAAIQLVGLAAPCTARAEPPRERQPVTVVLAGPDAALADLQASLPRDRSFPFDLRLAPLPDEPAPQVPGPELDAVLAAARADYVEAEFASCVARLDAGRIPRLLADGQRDRAARILFWRIACHVGAGQLPEATQESVRLAVYGLPAPPDVGATSPEVEVLLTRVQGEVAHSRRAPLRITTTARAAMADVDGKPGVCATPCTVDLAEGDHVVRVEADGMAPDWRSVRVGPQRGVRFDLTPANPALAARQWSARYARTAAIDSLPSVQLLSAAIHARRLVLLSGEPRRHGIELRGVLAVDGRVAARAARHSGGPRIGGEEARELVRDLLVQAELLEPAPGLLGRPLFWVAVSAAVVLAAGLTAWALYEPPTRTAVSF